MIKLVVVLMLMGIVGSLFSGLYYIYRDRETGVRTARALTLRIGLSISLFLLLLIGFRFGFIPGYTQVNKDEQDQPDHIDEVPVPGDPFESKMAFGGEMATHAA